MTNVKIARWLRWESSDDLTLNGVLEDSSVGGVLFLQVEGGREDGFLDELSSLGHLQMLIGIKYPNKYVISFIVWAWGKQRGK